MNKFRCVLLFTVMAILFGGCAGTRNQVNPNLLKVVPKRSEYAPPAVAGPDTVKGPSAQRTPPSFSMFIRPKSDWDSTPPNQSLMGLMGKIQCITVHHEGCQTPNNEVSEYAVKRILQITRKVHERVLGAGDIGYHFAIDRAGRIWEGRPLKYQGAHAGNPTANRGNVGIEVMGNFDKQRVNDAQAAALKWLLLRLMAQYDVGIRDVYTHQEVRHRFDLASTECPGRDLQAWVERFRRSYR